MGLKPLVYFFPQKWLANAAYYEVTYVDSDAKDVVRTQEEFDKFDAHLFVQAGGLITAYDSDDNALAWWHSSEGTWC